MQDNRDLKKKLLSYKTELAQHEANGDMGSVRFYLNEIDMIERSLKAFPVGRADRKKNNFKNNKN